MRIESQRRFMVAIIQKSPAQKNGAIPESYFETYAAA